MIMYQKLVYRFLEQFQALCLTFNQHLLNAGFPLAHAGLRAYGYGPNWDDYHRPQWGQQPVYDPYYQGNRYYRWGRDPRYDEDSGFGAVFLLIVALLVLLAFAGGPLVR
jgi:hypothetical protein